MNSVTNYTTPVYFPRGTIMRTSQKLALLTTKIAIVMGVAIAGVLTGEVIADLRIENARLELKVAMLESQLADTTLEADARVERVVDAVKAAAVAEVMTIAIVKEELALSLQNEKALLVKEASKGCTDKLLENKTIASISNALTETKDNLYSMIGM